MNQKQRARAVEAAYEEIAHLYPEAEDALDEMADEVLDQLSEVDRVDLMEEEFNASRWEPYMEFELKGDEWLTLHLKVNRNREGLMFECMEGLEHETWFSGDVREVGNSTYLLPFEGQLSLQDMLEQIHQEIMEGYILPNNLMPEEE